MAFNFFYGILLWSAGQEFEHARSNKIEFENEYDQGIYFPLAWTSILSLTLISMWYRIYEKEKYVLNKKLLILATSAFLIIFICSIIYSLTVLHDYSFGTRTMITSAFIAGSFAVFTSLMFFGYWSSNGYVFYKRHKFNIKECNEKYKKKRKKSSVNDPINVSKNKRENYYKEREEQKQSSDRQSKNSNEESSKLYDKEEDFRRKSLQANAMVENNKPQENEDATKNNPKENYLNMMKPDNQSDILTIVLFWSNFIILLIFLVVNAIVFEQVWIPFVAYFWTMMIESFLLGFIKYHSLNYEYRDKWVIIPACV